MSDGSAEHVIAAIRQALSEGQTVNIEGVGTFQPGLDGFTFKKETRPTMVIAYVREDLASARRLFHDLEKAGYNPWLDVESLLPGQYWPRAIDHAIELADFFLPCFSTNSLRKRSAFNSELRFALEYANQLPLDDMFIIPVRLDACLLPGRIYRRLQHVDLFADWDTGIARIRTTVRAEMARRRRATLPRAS